MNFLKITAVFLPLILVLLFFVLILAFAAAGRKRQSRNFREIPAFTRLRRAAGLSVEAGARLHVSLGRGGLTGVEGSSALAGLTMLERIARAASISDRPSVATAGSGVLGILTQDALKSMYSNIGAEGDYDPDNGRVSGLTPFSYAAGAMAVIHDEHVSASVLAGHLGSEVALITEAAERSGGLVIGGTDNVPAQAVIYAAAQEPLIGEELYAGGAYLGAGPAHGASLKTQDIFRWIIVVVILFGALAKLAGLL